MPKSNKYIILKIYIKYDKNKSSVKKKSTRYRFATTQKVKVTFNFVLFTRVYLSYYYKCELRTHAFTPCFKGSIY